MKDDPIDEYRGEVPPTSLAKLREDWCVGPSCGMINKDGSFAQLTPTPEPATDPYEMEAE